MKKYVRIIIETVHLDGTHTAQVYLARRISENKYIILGGDGNHLRRSNLKSEILKNGYFQIMKIDN